MSKYPLHAPFRRLATPLCLVGLAALIGSVEPVMADGRGTDTAPRNTAKATQMRTDESNLRDVEKFHQLEVRIASSAYVVKDGKLVARSTSVPIVSSGATADDKSVKIAMNGFEAASAVLNIPDGSGVVVIESLDFYEVIIGPPLESGKRGPDYSAKVLLNKKTLAVVQLLAGS